MGELPEKKEDTKVRRPAAAAQSTEEVRARLAKGEIPQDELRKLLTHPLAVVRAEVAEALAAKNDFEPIAELLRDMEPTLRVQVVRLLARARDPEAGFRFIRALRHMDPDVRQAAFEEVLKWKAGGREKLLLVALDDRDPRRRRVALDELRTLEAISRGLRDGVLQERAEQLFAEVGTDRLVAALGGGEDSAARALLRRRGAPAVQALVPKLESEKEAGSALDLIFELSPDAEKIAVDAWPRMAGSARARVIDRVPALARAATTDADERVRRAAVRILLRQNEWDSSWSKYLSLKVGEEGWTEWDFVLIVRKVAGEPGGTELLTGAAKGVYPLVRREAAGALYKRGDVEALAGLSESDDSWVVREAAMALGERSDPRAVFPLVRTTREARGAAARKAAELLKKYPRTETFEFTLEALRHKRGSVRFWGAEKLEGVSDPRAIEPLLALLDEESSDTQFAAIRALAKFAADPRVTGRLVKCLEYGDISVRQAAIEILGEAKAVAAVPAIIRTLGNGFLKVKAMAALKSIGDRQGFLAIMRRKRRDENLARERERIKKMQKQGV